MRGPHPHPPTSAGGGQEPSWPEESALTSSLLHPQLVVFFLVVFVVLVFLVSGVYLYFILCFISHLPFSLEEYKVLANMNITNPTEQVTLTGAVQFSLLVEGSCPLLTVPERGRAIS